MNACVEHVLPYFAQPQYAARGPRHLTRRALWGGRHLVFQSVKLKLLQRTLARAAVNLAADGEDARLDVPTLAVPRSLWARVSVSQAAKSDLAAYLPPPSDGEGGGGGGGDGGGGGGGEGDGSAPAPTLFSLVAPLVADAASSSRGGAQAFATRAGQVMPQAFRVTVDGGGLGAGAGLGLEIDAAAQAALYRSLLCAVVAEAHSEANPLFVPSPNAARGLGVVQDELVVNAARFRGARPNQCFGVGAAGCGGGGHAEFAHCTPLPPSPDGALPGGLRLDARRTVDGGGARGCGCAACVRALAPYVRAIRTCMPRMGAPFDVCKPLCGT